MFAHTVINTHMWVMQCTTTLWFHQTVGSFQLLYCLWEHCYENLVLEIWIILKIKHCLENILMAPVIVTFSHLVTFRIFVLLVVRIWSGGWHCGTVLNHWDSNILNKVPIEDLTALLVSRKAVDDCLRIWVVFMDVGKLEGVIGSWTTPKMAALVIWEMNCLLKDFFLSLLMSHCYSTFLINKYILNSI